MYIWLPLCQILRDFHNFLKWYKNYKNRLRLAKVIVKNKMSHFLWFTVYIQCKRTRVSKMEILTVFPAVKQFFKIASPLTKLPQWASGPVFFVGRRISCVFICTQNDRTISVQLDWHVSNGVTDVYRKSSNRSLTSINRNRSDPSVWVRLGVH